MGLYVWFVVVALAWNAAETEGSSSKVAKASNAFGFSLFQSVQRSEDNLLFSPWSLSTVLSMVYLGARNKTAAQLAQALQLNHFFGDEDGVFNAYRDEAELLRGNNVQDDFLSSTITLTRSGDKIARSYLSNLEKYFSSGVFHVDFSEGDKVLRLVNSQVSKFTKGKIPQMLHKSPDPLTTLLLLNSVYFKGVWEKSFNDTAPAVFYGAKNETTVDMMHLKSDFNFAYDRASGSYVLQIPYSGSQISFIIVLPAKNERNLERLQLSAEFLDTMCERLEPRSFELSLPRFAVQSQMDLKGALKTMGVKSLFSAAEADLTGMSKDGGLFVEDVHHRASMEVNEHGTEATASTAAVIVSRIGTPRLAIDRPFFFAIRHMPTGLNLFMGRVLNL
ncbi:intracellular coagulation inhibitor 1-like [Ornithodoros turicata]|uniref:intracellular coagulation inhibitor 1-like n=1 Tax=Ornithodoros turicata TaxID=34597 RepID=UPI00313A247C